VLHMNVRPSLLAGEEVEAVPANAEDGRTHNGR
jgi:hypothetical protein